MKNIYGVNVFTMESGERYCLVVDRSNNLPMFYPNLFLTTQIRNRSDSFSTMETAASNLVILLRFVESRRIDLEQRLLSWSFFSLHELDDLRDFSLLKQGKQLFSDRLALWQDLGKYVAPTVTVSNGTLYSRLTTFANYLQWLAKYLLDKAGQEVMGQINAMSDQIKERRPSKRGRSGDPQDRSLSDVQLKILFEIIRPRSELNPFLLDVQRRNRLMILLLYHLGIRGGELLSIRIGDIDFTANRLQIFRRADDEKDHRIREPNTKTRGRILPLGDTLVKELHDYIIKDRRKVQHSKKNTFLFVTHKSGPTIGQPISKAGYYKIMSIVRAVSPQLYQVTGHMLRHTWNRKFSEKMDEMNERISEEQQEKIRSFLMGWKEGSGTSSIYNRRFIQQKGYVAALLLQETGGVCIPASLNNENE